MLSTVLDTYRFLIKPYLLFSLYYIIFITESKEQNKQDYKKIIGGLTEFIFVHIKNQFLYDYSEHVFSIFFNVNQLIVIWYLYTEKYKIQLHIKDKNSIIASKFSDNSCFYI